MGNQLGAAVPPDYTSLPELQSLAFVERLGGGRFVKTLKCAMGDGQLLVVKVYVKRDASERLSAYEEMLTEVRSRLSVDAAPNVMPFRWFKEGQHVAYLARQFLHSTLLERITTPPFLTAHEKLWIGFQLLMALSQCHGAGVVHGDIKGENVMLTSAGWLQLTDLGNFKPALLPADDPADFSFYFDGGGTRRSCYLAPERFGERPLANHPTASSGLQPSMDVFSAGCVLLELFLECGPAFDLPKLLRYRKGEGSAQLAALLARVEPPKLQDVLRGMTACDPSERPTANECLEMLRGDTLPEAFYSYIHPFLASLRLLDCERQALRLCDAAPEILAQMAPRTSSLHTDGAADALLKNVGTPNWGVDTATSFATREKGDGAYREDGASGRNGYLGWAEKGAVAYLSRVEELWRKEAASEAPNASPPTSQNDLVTSMPAISATHSPPSAAASSPSPSPLVVAVAPFCACIRSIRSPALLLRTLRTLLRLALFCDDSVKTQRVLPYFVTCLSSPLPTARAEALHLIVDLLSSVNFLQPADTRLLPDYVLPAVGRCATDQESVVRCALALRLGELATIAKRFLETAQWVRTLSITEQASSASAGSRKPSNTGAGDAGGSNSSALSGAAGATSTGVGGVVNGGAGLVVGATISCDSGSKAAGAPTVACGQHDGLDAVAASTLRSFDTELATLQEQISHVAVAILTDAHSSAAVKRSLLSGVTSLAIFLGRQSTNDMLLPLLITFLNDRDPALRAAFFEGVGGVCAFVGRASLQAFILPCIMQALTDVDEPVICAALESLCRLSEVGLHPRGSLLEVTVKVAPLLCHPNAWVRSATIGYIATLSSHFSTAEVFARVCPLLRPFLRHPIIFLTPAALQAALRPPASRLNFDRALAAAAEQAETETGSSGANITAYGRLGDSESPDIGTALSSADDAGGGADAEAVELLLSDASDDDTDGGFSALSLRSGDEGFDRTSPHGRCLSSDASVDVVGGDPARETSSGTSVCRVVAGSADRSARSSRVGLVVGGSVGATACGPLSPLHGIDTMPAIAEEGSADSTIPTASQATLRGLPHTSGVCSMPSASQSPRPLPMPPPSAPLDLSALHDISHEEAVTLQAMREYIRAASVVKLAKVRMWETDNSALLQLDGGGGGAALLAYRQLSRRVRVQRLVPPPSAPWPTSTGPADGNLADVVGTPRAAGIPNTSAPHPSVSVLHDHFGSFTVPRVSADSNSFVARTGAGGGAFSSTHDGVGADSISAPSMSTAGGSACSLNSFGRSGSSLFRSSAATSTRRSSPMRAESGDAASGSHGGCRSSSNGAASARQRATSDLGWPPGTCVPSSSRTHGRESGGDGPQTWCPRGDLVAQIRAHADGVRSLALTADGNTLLSLGKGGAALKAWPLRSVEAELDHAQHVAAHSFPQNVESRAMATCAGGRDVALAIFDRTRGQEAISANSSADARAVGWSECVSILSIDRLGDSVATSFRLPLAPEGGSLLGLGSIDGAAGLILVSTEDGNVRAVDTRANRDAWVLKHEKRLGLMQAWTTGGAGTWIATGSSTGNLCLWDIRYTLRIASWRLPGCISIRAMAHATSPPDRTSFYSPRPSAADASGRPLIFLGGAGGIVTGWTISGSLPKCAVALQPAAASDDDTASATATAVDAASAEMSSLRSSATWSTNGGTAEVRAILAASDGTAICTASTDRVVRVWRPGAADPPPRQSVHAHVDEVQSAQQIDEANSAVAVGSALCVSMGGPRRNGSAFWRRLSGSGIPVLKEANPGVVPSVAFGGITAGEGSGGLLAGIEGGAHVEKEPGPTTSDCQAAVTSAVWSGAHSSGFLISGSLDGVLHFWR